MVKRQCAASDRNYAPMQSLIVSDLGVVDDTVEIVERKGLGHPDTICDALAETLSRNLCREYKTRFGTILHHNVDKALLCGGSAAPAFGAGTLLAPINIYLAGTAVRSVGDDSVQSRRLRSRVPALGCAATCTRWTQSFTCRSTN